MKAEEYLSQNRESIREEYLAISSKGANAIITIKENEGNYVHKVSSVEKFIEAIPDNEFFKKMRDGINNAVLNKVVPIVIFEEKKARLISLPDYFK